MRLIETHTHLFMAPLSDDTASVLTRAAERGVTDCIVPAYDLASWPQVVELASRFSQIHAALGQHPWVASEIVDMPPGGHFDEAQFSEALAKAVAAGQPCAIGEIGLDYKVENAQLELQRRVLQAQLALAVDLDLPVILHCRGAFDDLLEIVDPFTPRLRGVLHAFSRSTEVAQRFIKAGLHIALGGAVTRPNARRVRQAAADLPLDHLVLETDSPSIGLDGVLPAETEPHHVRDVAEALAQLRQVSTATIAEATTANAVALFHL